MPITLFTVGGVDVDPLLEGFEIRETTGDVSTLTCDIESIGSPVTRFSVHQEVIVEEDDERIFAGTITQTHERGFGGPNLFDAETDAPQIVTTITAEDWYRLPQRVYYTGTIAEGTSLKSALTTLIAGDLGDLDVTLDASQVDGPSLPAMTFTRKLVSDVLKAFSDATGYLSRVAYDKTLRMWAPGDIAAPYDIDEDDDPAKWTGDVEVESILGDDYANHVTITGSLVTQYSREETFTGDGSTTEFTLEYTPFANRGYVTSGGIFETLRTPDDPDTATWTLDGQTLTRTSAPADGDSIVINFDGTFTPFATAEDTGEIALYGLYAYVEERDDITESDAAQSLADQRLAEKLNSGSQTVGYQSRHAAPTLRAGQQLTITAPSRSLSGDYIVTDMTVQAEVPATSEFAPTLGLIRSINVKKSNPLAGKWQQTFQDWLEGGTGGGAAPSVATAGPPATGPGAPNRAVQVNRSGKFGGDEDFIYYEAENSIVCGDASSITAADFAECFVFGNNCHISD